MIGSRNGMAAGVIGRLGCVNRVEFEPAKNHEANLGLGDNAEEWLKNQYPKQMKTGPRLTPHGVGCKEPVTSID